MLLSRSKGKKVNPKKIQAILDMKYVSKVKKVHRLTDCLATLGHFLSKSGDKCHYFLLLSRRKLSLDGR